MTKTTKAKETTFSYTFKAPALVRKGFRAYVGMFGAAYEAAVPVYEKAVRNYDEYAKRGEKLEAAATSYAKDARKNVTDFAKARFKKRRRQLRSLIPGAANDRVVELEAEIAKLNRKIAGSTKTAAKKAVKKAA